MFVLCRKERKQMKNNKASQTAERWLPEGSVGHMSSNVSVTVTVMARKLPEQEPRSLN